jgi:hypothetical protein
VLLPVFPPRPSASPVLHDLIETTSNFGRAGVDWALIIGVLRVTTTMGIAGANIPAIAKANFRLNCRLRAIRLDMTGIDLISASF